MLFTTMYRVSVVHFWTSVDTTIIRKEYITAFVTESLFSIPLPYLGQNFRVFLSD